MPRRRSRRSRYTRFNQRSPNSQGQQDREEDVESRSLEELFAEARDRELLRTKEGIRAATVLSLLPEDQLARSLLQEEVQLDRIREAKTAPGFIRRRENNGNVFLGLDLFEGFPHLAQLQNFGRNSVILGIQGCGKTTLSAAIGIQLAKLNVSTCWIDSERNDLYPLLEPLYRYCGLRLYRLDARKLPHNPLEFCPGVSPQEHVEHCSHAIGMSLSFLEAGTRLLRKHTLREFLKRGVLNHSGDVPNLIDVFESISRDKRANDKSSEAVRARTETLLDNVPGLRYRKGETADVLAQHHVVIECGGVSPEYRDLLTVSLILQLFEYRKAQGVRNAELSWWCCIDDAQGITSSPDSFLARRINVLRSLGMALTFNCQIPQLIAPGIISACPTKLCGTLASARDVRLMASSMGLLTTEQARFLSTRLDRGQFLVQLNSGWRHPFCIQVEPPTLPHQKF